MLSRSPPLVRLSPAELALERAPQRVLSGFLQVIRPGPLQSHVATGSPRGRRAWDWQMDAIAC